jgi:hypothetical protein
VRGKKLDTGRRGIKRERYLSEEIEGNSISFSMLA